MNGALQSGKCDLVGTGRLSILRPQAAKETFLTRKSEEDAKVTIESPAMPYALKLLGLESMFCVNITEFYAQKMWKLGGK
jgi:hypothetical protein